MVKGPNHSSDGYAKLFWVPAALALLMLIPSTLLSVALFFYYMGSLSIAPPVMSVVFFSSFVCIFVSVIVALSGLLLWVFGVVEFKHIRRAAVLALLAFVMNYFVFSFVVYRFYRPH